MKYPAYEKYEDTGIEWLKRIPNGWKKERLYDIASIRTSNVDKKTVEGQRPVKLCNYTDVYYNEKIHSGIEFMLSSASEEEIKKFRLFEGDVIITKDSESPYDIGVASYVEENIDDLVCGYHLAIIKPNKSDLYGPYLYYAISCDISAYQFCIAANGVTRFGLSYNGMKNIIIPVPSINEQQKISDFLSQKTAQIDRLIEKKQALIEKLNEKRTAMITRAVIKGIDENVLMKDSGVEWLGKVPGHWDLIRLRFILSEKLINGIFKKAEEWGSGVRIVNVFDVYAKNDVVQEEKLDRLECGDEEQEKYSALYGDFFFVRSSLKLEGVGKSAVVLEAEEKMVFECHLVRGRPDLKIMDPRFLNLFLNSKYSRGYFVSMANMVTMATIDQNKFKDLKVCLPPLAEQKKIVRTIDKEIFEIETLTSHVMFAIKRLKEYRIALITAAVTGKIKVS